MNMMDQIIAYVEASDYVTFAELCRDIPGFEATEDAEATETVALAENIILWAGLTPTGREALLGALYTGRIHMLPANPLTYAMDGARMTLPVLSRTKKPPKAPPKKPHWFPVTFRPGPYPDDKSTAV